MAAELPAHIWFVRSNGGSGSYPVRPEGWRVVWIFVAGVVVSTIVALLLAFVGSTWLWALAFAAGMAASAWYFIGATRKHTDYSIRYSDYLKDKNNA
ncbi:hypothetical protein RB623_24085 [Mesorhizobium sp. LHD-90]|uniref:hypothetical protein n=1 Tax=Mesorhizobium sp. LHD-90 TaxID=3071414 RepID=UPI0027E1D4AE|nr:hypothetical protein [Mesorhizobium sp. LHD-90]MDQ6437145.1 hypothetical protein [Mesorhizobium sp. LHD-90]